MTKKKINLNLKKQFRAKLSLVLWEDVKDMRKFMVKEGDKKKNVKDIVAFYEFNGKFKGKTLNLGEIHLSKQYSTIEFFSHEVAHAVRSYITLNIRDAFSYVTDAGGYADELVAYLTGNINGEIQKELKEIGWLIV